MLATVLAAKIADAADGLAVTDEGSGDVVDVLGQAKEDVLTIALGDGGQRDVYKRQGLFRGAGPWLCRSGCHVYPVRRDWRGGAHHRIPPDLADG